MTTVADIVSGFADPDANIIFGTVIDDTFKVRSCFFLKCRIRKRHKGGFFLLP
jgi:cell division GTPase FtsZ